MATVSIEIAGMRTLVSAVETARDGIPADQSSVRSALDRVMLPTDSVNPADHVVAWIDGELPGLRRRLAMAVHLEAATPGLQSYVQFDESMISTLTPAEAKALADSVAAKIRGGDGSFDDDLLKVLEENGVDPYFSSALAKQLSPEQIADFVQNMYDRRYPIEQDIYRDPNALKDFDAQYGRWLDALGTSLGIATMQHGSDLKLPDDYSQQWLHAMTNLPEFGGDGRPGQASWAALVISRGTWSKDFTVDVTRGLWKFEKDQDMRGMWNLDANPAVGAYTGAVDPSGKHTYDPLALVLQAVGRNQDAAIDLFTTNDKVTVTVDGQQRTTDAFLKYLISERKWPVDGGEGAKEAIAAGMTPMLGGSTDSTKVAEYARNAVDAFAEDVEARAEDGGNWFSDIGHMVLDGLGLVPVVGEAFDAINGIWYYAEGDVIDGSLSMAAVIPVLGWAATGGKWVNKGRKALEAVELVGKDGRKLDTSLDSFKLLAKADNVEPGVFRFDDLADFNRACNNPHPGVTYEYKGMRWTTDELGRTEYVSGKLSLDSPGRDPKLQRDIGNGPDAKDTDVGFHLIADSLGGPTNKLNVVPGNGKPIDDGLANLNQGEYARMERKLRSALGDNKDVSIDIVPRYSGPGTRPDSFVVRTTIDGVPEKYLFVNK